MRAPTFSTQAAPRAPRRRPAQHASAPDESPPPRGFERCRRSERSTGARRSGSCCPQRVEHSRRMQAQTWRGFRAEGEGAQTTRARTRVARAPGTK
eukprot:scaffold10693_cov70-Phaeocystis_antarctica.AAC.4